MKSAILETINYSKQLIISPDIDGFMSAKLINRYNDAIVVGTYDKNILIALFNKIMNWIKQNVMDIKPITELKEAELMTNRLTLLGAVDPYTGRYYSQAWIQRNVLRLTDDEIKEMQTEMDEEKEMGLGLPVGVTNDVAQAQMMSSIPQQPQNPEDQQDTQQEENTFSKLKRIL